MGFTTNDSLRKYTTLLQRHTDNNGNNVCEEIKDEVKQVIDREVLLEQIPHPYMGISVVYSEKNAATNNVTNTILKEIEMNETLTSFDQMKIDYDTGKIILHYTLEGKYINISYWGMGYNLINSSRVYTKLDENGNVIQTLEDIIEILRNMNNAGYIVDTLQNLETEIGKLKIPVIDDANIKTDKTYSNTKIENRLKNEIDNHRHDASDIDNLPSGGSGDAKDVVYDNTTSKLVSTKVQGAIDELVVKDNELTSKTNELTSKTNENTASILELSNQLGVNVQELIKTNNNIVDLLV